MTYGELKYFVAELLNDTKADNTHYLQ